MASIFISYRRSDSQATTGRIYDRLAVHFGKDAVFKDVDSIPAGVDFRDFLDQTLSQCEVLLAVIGRAWQGSTDNQGRLQLHNPEDWVRIEVEEALSRKEVLVVPVLVDGAKMPEVDTLPASIRALTFRNYRYARPDPDFNKDMERLIMGLDEYFTSKQKLVNEQQSAQRLTVSPEKVRVRLQRIMTWCGLFAAFLFLVYGINRVWSYSIASSEQRESFSAQETSEGDLTVDNFDLGSDAFAGLPLLKGEAIIELVVNGGTISITVDGNNAPVTAGNFVDLVQRGVYDGVSFHRVVKSPEPFVVQGGDPQSKDPSVAPQMLGTGSFIDPATNEPRYIPLEIKPVGADSPLYSRTFDEARISGPPVLPHTRGALAMARSQLPDSASAQFYFALADLPFLDGSYAVFGYVTEGMDIVDSVEQGDIVESATVVAGIENLQQPE